MKIYSIWLTSFYARLILRFRDLLSITYAASAQIAARLGQNADDVVSQSTRLTSTQRSSYLKIHAIQTGTVSIRPNQRAGTGFGPLRLINTLTDRRWTEPLPILVWVIEHPEGIIVIDTGETSRATLPGYFPAWHPYFKNLKEQLTPEQEIGPQLQAIGIQPNDVRRVVMTHLHTDHAGGLQHFPKSEILIMRRAFDRAIGFRGQLRGFLPQRWPIGFTPTLIDLEPQPFGPFPSSLKLTHAGDVIIVPTSGHTEAHISVILQNSDRTYFSCSASTRTWVAHLAFVAQLNRRFIPNLPAHSSSCYARSRGYLLMSGRYRNAPRSYAPMSHWDPKGRRQPR